MGLHKFGLGQHTSAYRKVLKYRSEQHQFIADIGTTPSLEDYETLTALYGVSLTSILAMERGAHAWLKMVLYTLLGRDHSTE